MAATREKKRLGLDANLPFDLAAGKDSAFEFTEVFESKGYTFHLPPTAAYELWIIADKGGNERARGLASTALRKLNGWGIKPFDLPSLQQSIAEQFARRLIRSGPLPVEEMNDGLILAETSLAEIPLLVTSDKHLLDVDETALRLPWTARLTWWSWIMMSERFAV